MAKASISGRDAVDTQFGVQEGNVEIVSVTCKIHQFPPSKKTGDQSEPAPYARVMFQKLDADMNPTSDEPVEEFFGIGKIDKFHPGKAEGPDDEDPEDLGSELNTEGNCIFLTEETNRLSKKSKWIMFVTSLEEKGFNPDITGKGFLSDLVGTKLHVFTKVLPKGFYGADNKSDKDPSALLCDKVFHFPYEGKGKKAAPKSKAPAAGVAANASKVNGSAAAVTGKIIADDPDQIGKQAIAFLVNDARFVGKEEVERKKFQQAIQMKLMTDKVETKLHKPVLDLVRDDEWLMEQAVVHGVIVDTDAQTLTFPAAA